MSQHQGGTDSVHKVTLPSDIQSASWCVQSAGAGETVPLEVYTLFVGDGSEIKCEVRTKAGKTVGKVQGKVGQNRYVDRFLIPDNANEDIYFEAQLPKHGLKARSNLLRVFPLRTITNARWDRQEARRGDLVKLAADTRNIPDDTRAKVFIYEHDVNGSHDLIAKLSAEVRQNRLETVWEYNYHEKTEELLTKEESQTGYNPPRYFFEMRAGTAKAKSELLEFKDWTEITLIDVNRNPVPNAEYVLHMPDGSQRRGRLGANGRASVKDVPPGKVRVEFPNP